MLATYETTFHVSSNEDNSECHKVAEMFESMGMTFYISKGTAVSCNAQNECKREPTCRVDIPNFPRNYPLPHQTWSHVFNRMTGGDFSHVHARIWEHSCRDAVGGGANTGLFWEWVK